MTIEKVKKSKEIVVLEKSVSPVLDQARKLEIKGAEDMKVAVELLSKLNQINDKITAEKERVTRPLNEALRAERSRWRPIEEINGEAISLVRGKMTEYQTAEVRRQREEEIRIAARVGEGRGKLKVETAVRKIEEVERVDKEVATRVGLVQFRETKVLKIVDAAAIPREYLVVDEKKVLEDLKAGKSIAGAEIEIIQVPVNYR